ncbi:MAG: homoserine dehydrogenase [Chloroflexi bacterium]|nr:homoserine dehydrogenase [Chloroflexota bacterium]
MSKGTRSIKIAILGLGVVGNGVLETLTYKKNAFKDQFASELDVSYILVKDLNKPRELYSSNALITDDYERILSDDSVDIVVEVMGGDQPAFDYIKRAMENGKSVVTANKEVISKHGQELMSIASINGVHLLFEASVGGGIPIIRPLSKDLNANDVDAIRSIINGTTNYILTNMTYMGSTFAEALDEAQTLGYAESDPTNDVEGIDAVYKLSIMASLAFRSQILPQDVYREGISNLTANDFKYAKELGYVIKLMAIAKRQDSEIDIRVHPSLLPEEAPLAKVNGVYNAIQVHGDLVGHVLFQGQGAGGNATASAVVGDIIDVSGDLVRNATPVSYIGNGKEFPIRSIAELVSRYYIRLTVEDRPGVMAKLTDVLGSKAISIASIIQKESDTSLNSAELVITTYPSKEADVQDALNDISELDVVRSIGSTIRIESGSAD